MEPTSENHSYHHKIPLLRDVRSQARAAATVPATTLPRGDARERPLFTRAEVAELLALPALDVLKLAAAHDVAWVLSSTGTGPQFSARAVKQLIQATLAMRTSAAAPALARFDRAALVWYMLHGQPQRAQRAPDYKQRFEQELARVAKLDEPARSLRITELQDAWKDAKVIAGSLRQPVL